LANLHISKTGISLEQKEIFENAAFFFSHRLPVNILKWLK